MVQLIETIKRHVPENAINQGRLKKQGCIVKMNDIPNPNLTLDLDKIKKADDSKNADFLFASEDDGGWILVIELKRGRPDISHAIEQLQSAAKLVEKWINSEDVENFMGVLVSGGLSRYQSSKLKKMLDRGIRFKGENRKILRIACGSELKRVFVL